MSTVINYDLTLFAIVRLCTDNFDFVHLEVAGFPIALAALVVVLIKPQHRMLPLILAIISMLFSGVFIYYSVELTTCTGEIQKFIFLKYSFF